MGRKESNQTKQTKPFQNGTAQSKYSYFAQPSRNSYFAQSHSRMVSIPTLRRTNNYIIEPWHEISNNEICATSKGSDQTAHTRSLIRAFASRLSILWLLSYWLNTIWRF